MNWNMVLAFFLGMLIGKLTLDLFKSFIKKEGGK